MHVVNFCRLLILHLDKFLYQKVTFLIAKPIPFKCYVTTYITAEIITFFFICLSFLFLTSEIISWLPLNVQLHGFFSSSETVALYIKFILLFPHASLFIFTSSNTDFFVSFYHPVIQYCKDLPLLFAAGFHF